MSLMDRIVGALPDSMKTGGTPAAKSAPEQSPPPPATSLGGAALRVVPPTYGAPPPDQVLTDKIIGMVTDTVPAVKDLLAEAEKIQGMEPDLGKRLSMLMTLRGFTPLQASDAVTALGRALAAVKQQNETAIARARAEQVERPAQSVTTLTAQKEGLQKQIADIDLEIAATQTRAAEAASRIQTEEAKLQASVAQAQGWIDGISRLITKT